MVTQSLPPLYDAYVREQRRLTGGAVAEVRRQWRRMGDDFDRSWSTVGPSILTVTSATQRRLVENAGDAVPEVLEVTSTGPLRGTGGRVSSAGFVGVAGDGRSAAGLVEQAVVHSKRAVGAGLYTREALLSGLAWLTMATTTLLADTSRAAEVVAAATRGATSYVRVIQPGACSRCAILAGRSYASSTAFLRHPGCLCEHMPVNGMEDQEIAERGYIVSPEGYFDSLPSAAELDAAYPDLTVAMRRELGLYSQEDIFTRAGAEVIRNGADPIQVVNARRGMMRAQSGRLAPTEHGAFITFEGTTARGWANRAMRSHVPAGRQGIARLMPESIVRIARGDQAKMRELLIKFGYLTP